MKNDTLLLFLTSFVIAFAVFLVFILLASILR